MTIRSQWLTAPSSRALAALLCAVALAMPATSAWAAEPLRVCADPDNLPFSKSEGPERGLYVDLAELVAKQLDATPIKYTWWLTFYQRRALRNTAGECDAVFALPTDADYRARGLQKTAAFLDVGYALVSAPDFKFNGVDDLKGKRLAVQFQTNPHILLAQRNDLPFSTFKNADEVFASLARGEVDAGFLWGPVAGYDNLRQHGGRWKVTPLTGPDLTGQVSVAVQRDKPELAKNIDAALASLKPEIAALAAKYGFPQVNPVKLTLVAKGEIPPTASITLLADTGVAKGSAVVVPAQWFVKTQAKPEDAGAAKPSVKAEVKAKTPSGSGAAKAGIKAQGATTAATAGAAMQVAADQAPALSAEAQLGRVRFNDQCSHCHGSDGASPIRERDVRRLKMRYDAKWRDMAVTTIKNGRNDLGMPPWKEILKEPEIDQLLSFIETVQK
jgi:polar amino acid transport system substrate-binding protein